MPPFDLRTATRADFEATLNETWTLHDGGRDFPFTLVEVRPLGQPIAAGFREPFVLVFRFREPLRVPQRIHHWEHPRLGVVELFVAQTSGTEVEAIIS